MISGMYMGELVRRILVHLINERQLFVHVSEDSLLFNAGLSTAFVSQVLKLVKPCCVHWSKSGNFYSLFSVLSLFFFSMPNIP